MHNDLSSPSCNEATSAKVTKKARLWQLYPTIPKNRYITRNEMGYSNVIEMWVLQNGNPNTPCVGVFRTCKMLYIHALCC
jgi:hypothetical protein